MKLFRFVFVYIFFALLHNSILLFVLAVSPGLLLLHPLTNVL